MAVVQKLLIRNNLVIMDDNIIGLPHTQKQNYFYKLQSKETQTADLEYGPGPGIYYNAEIMLD